MGVKRADQNILANFATYRKGDQGHSEKIMTASLDLSASVCVLAVSNILSNMASTVKAPSARVLSPWPDCQRTCRKRPMVVSALAQCQWHPRLDCVCHAADVDLALLICRHDAGARSFDQDLIAIVACHPVLAIA